MKSGHAPNKQQRKIIVICGTTASGKTKLAVALAKRFNGEIISADSRQVYRGMDFGTGKDLDEYVVKSKIQKSKSKANPKTKNSNYKVVRIPYHLIDVVSPKEQFTLADWLSAAEHIISRVLKQGRVPIVCGGTGLYISALVDGYQLPKSNLSEVQARMLRSRLGRMTLRQLVSRLKSIDPSTYRIIDKSNRRRVQRAVEIYYQSGIAKSAQLKKIKPDYDFLVIGVTYPLKILAKRIHHRLMERLKQGMVTEVQQLKNSGLVWQRLEAFGLEYRYISRYLQKKISYDTMADDLDRAIRHYARRQMAWFRRNPNIVWVNSKSEVVRHIKKFITAD